MGSILSICITGRRVTASWSSVLDSVRTIFMCVCLFGSDSTQHNTFFSHYVPESLTVGVRGVQCVSKCSEVHATPALAQGATVLASPGHPRR